MKPVLQKETSAPARLQSKPSAGELAQPIQPALAGSTRTRSPWHGLGFAQRVRRRGDWDRGTICAWSSS